MITSVRNGDRKKSEKRERVSIAVPPAILADVDAIVADREARTGSGSRSAFIVEAIIEKIELAKRTEAIERAR